jgi:hypothetical protein
MKLLVAIYRILIGPPMALFTEDLHVQQLNNWLVAHNRKFVHSQCTWHVADDHPLQGFYHGSDFYDWYTDQLADTHHAWNEVVNTVIGSQIGGIVIGNYHFQHKMNGLRYTAPFTHFYQIHQGQIVGVRFFIGEVSIRLNPLRQIAEPDRQPNRYAVPVLSTVDRTNGIVYWNAGEFRW